MKKHVKHIRQSRRGFTLLELLIVLAIIVAVVALLVPNLLGSRDIALARTTKATIMQIENQMKLYNANHNKYLSGGDEILTELTQPQDIDGMKKIYLEQVPVDAWNNPLHYEWNGTGHSKKQDAIKPAIWSNGPDGQDNGGEGDDINNWVVKQPNSN